MRALFLIPGGSSQQLQAFAAVDAVSQQLQAEVQVVCPPASAPLWPLHPAVGKVIPFAFDSATLADWANLLGSVREPDFQLVINLASGRQVDLMLSMSHIPTRIAASGFSATERIQAPPSAGWPNQNLAAYLSPIGVELNADAFRLPMAKASLEEATAALPAGDGPVLLLAPAGGANDWPEPLWQQLPERIRRKLPNLRSITAAASTAAAATASPAQRAAQVATADVVLASDPLTVEWALLFGVPLVALGRETSTLPVRQGVQGVGSATELQGLSLDAVLLALGLG